MKQWRVTCKICNGRYEVTSSVQPNHCSICGAPHIVVGPAYKTTFNDYLSDKIRAIVREEFSGRPLHHREIWSAMDYGLLKQNFRTFVRDWAQNRGRSEDAIRIKLLRLIRREYPTDWEVAQKS